MTTATATHRPSTSLSRIRALLGAELTQLRRNSTQLFYSVLMPPLLMLPLLSMEWLQTDGVGTFALIGVFLMALLFAVYYWATTVLVTRRESRVLLRFLTGETTKSDLLVGIISPAFLITLAQLLLTGGVLVYLDAVPPMPAIHLAIVSFITGVIIFGTLAVLTAAWTKTAEAAQMSTMPLMFATLLGTGLLIPFRIFPEPVVQILSYTPLAAIPELMSLGLQGTSMIDGAVDSIHGAATQPLIVVAAWSIVLVIASVRYMRWHPRA